MRITMAALAIPLAALALISGCGGSGGGTAANTPASSGT